MTQLHSAQDAIEQAIEGGWLPKGYGTFIKNPIEASFSIYDSGSFIYLKGQPQSGGWDGGKEKINLTDWNILKSLTDPLFWQALGKARGWGKEANLQGGPHTNQWSNWIPYCWAWFAHEWFEVCMVGGDEAKFWQSLP